MDSQNKESFWKQVFMRLHVTDDDRAIFPAGSVLPLDVTTARPLVGDEEVLVTKLLSEKFGKNVEIASRTVDPSVVGGIAVRYEDHIFDATVKRQLEKMDELMKTIHLREESLSGTDHLTDALKAGVEHFDNEVGLEEIGIVKTVGDGICTATGLGGAMSGELVSLHDGIYGMVQNLWPQEVGIVLLGGASQVKEGDTVRRTGKIMSIPVSEEMLGRIISPLGLPLDGRGSIKASDYRPIDHRLLALQRDSLLMYLWKQVLRLWMPLFRLAAASVNSLSVTAEREKRPLPSILSSIKKVRTSSAFM